VISANATENDFFNTIGKADVAQKTDVSHLQTAATNWTIHRSLSRP
jgi:SAM-dependent MidA family methyltransferase